MLSDEWVRMVGENEYIVKLDAWGFTINLKQDEEYNFAWEPWMEMCTPKAQGNQSLGWINHKEAHTVNYEK